MGFWKRVASTVYVDTQNLPPRAYNSGHFFIEAGVCVCVCVSCDHSQARIIVADLATVIRYPWRKLKFSPGKI